MLGRRNLAGNFLEPLGIGNRDPKPAVFVEFAVVKGSTVR
jgi:hypothetical protein